MQKGFLVGAAAVVVGGALWGIFLFRLWQPERQVRLHQEHLLKAIERRHWSKVSGMMADDYADRWGGDKAETPRLAGQALRHFAVLSIRTVSEQYEGGLVTAQLRLSGQGSPVAEVILDRVNRLQEPFVFEWVHRSGCPWDWQLRRLEQPELSTEAVMF